MASPISSRIFGVLPTGQTVEAWTLTGRGGLVVEAITYGGIVIRLLAPDRDGRLDDVVLGFADLDSYLAGHPYFGAITGRVAGRITGAAFTLDGHTYQLAHNEPPHHLHGGVEGFDKRLWRATPIDRGGGTPSLRLSYRSPDGEEGYPGNVEVAVTYTVTDQNAFRIETEATSDRTTPLCLTHHSYFNLAGEASGSIADHWLEIFANEVVSADERLALSGRLESASRHGNDFRVARRIGDAISHLFQGHGDLYRLPAGGNHAMQLAARLADPTSGRMLTVATTEGYLQLYTGSHLTGSHRGKSGVVYGRHAGICLECEGYPDVSNPELRGDTLIRPGQTQMRATEYAFTVRAGNNNTTATGAPRGPQEETSRR